MTERQSISVVINTYNAQRHLIQVLQSVSHFDEVVVCDMESTDGTVTIAKSMGAKVVRFPRGENNIVEVARQFALDSAQGPWILVIDADEVVTPKLYDYLRQRTEQPDCPAGLFVPFRNQVLGHTLHKRDYHLRFFRKDCTVWPPTIHSTPQVSGRVEWMKRNCGAEIVHLDENRMGQRLEKINRYTDNELRRGKSRQWGVAALFYRPLWRFFKTYVLQAMYRDGAAGFVASVYEAMYQFALVAKMLERRVYIDQDETEDARNERSKP